MGRRSWTQGSSGQGFREHALSARDADSFWPYERNKILPNGLEHLWSRHAVHTILTMRGDDGE